MSEQQGPAEAGPHSKAALARSNFSPTPSPRFALNAGRGVIGDEHSTNMYRLLHLFFGNQHSTDIESTPPPCVLMSIHSEGKSCSDPGRILVLNDPTPWQRRRGWQRRQRPQQRQRRRQRSHRVRHPDSWRWDHVPPQRRRRQCPHQPWQQRRSLPIRGANTRRRQRQWPGPDSQRQPHPRRRTPVPPHPHHI